MTLNLMEFEPRLLWKYFDAIRQIPRESGNEKAAGDYVVSVAKKFKLDYDRDETGNIVIRVPATSGKKNAQTVVLQGHLDMVCEKNSDVKFDFAKDPIAVRKEDDWLYATGTTLGSDNGIGLAAALAIIEDDSAVHGPLELLFTVDEETGLTGASQIRPNFLKGKKYINLDSEEEGVFFIGCSGGADTQIFLNLDLQKPSFNKAVKVHVSGLKGGHSGLDIDKNRGNAIKFLTRMLWQAQENVSFQLASINGGSKRNAIPREIFAELVVNDNQYTACKEALETGFAELKAEYKSVETDVKLTITDLSSFPERVMSSNLQQKLINLLYALPNGVQQMSADIPDLVETSVNLAIVKMNDKQVEIALSSRSSINSALASSTQQLRAFAELAGAEVEQPEGYPGWAPNLDSEILNTVKNTYKKLYNKEPELKAIHAGLECGIIGEKFPGMDMVSLGPQIENPHSPDERVHIPSVERFYDLLKAALKELT